MFGGCPAKTFSPAVRNLPPPAIVVPDAPARPVPKAGQDLGLIAQRAYAYGDEAVARLAAGRENYTAVFTALGGEVAP